MEPFNTTHSRRNKILLIAGLAIGLLAIAVFIFWMLRQPGKDDYSVMKDQMLTEVSKTQEKLAPALNAYLAEFKKHEDQTGSVEQAAQKSQAVFDDFKQAETQARTALDTMSRSKATNDREVGQSVEQLVGVYSSQTDFYSGMATSYKEYRALFAGKGNDVCMDIFIGETSNITDRKDRLKSAAANCYEGIAKLKDSRNEALSEYAKKLEKRLKLLETDAAATATAEQKYLTFIPQKDEFARQVAEAESRQAPDEDYQPILAKIQALNREINENRADFDFSAARYIRTVKEIPPLQDTVFSTHTPEKLKYFKSLGDVRLKTLRLALEDKLLAN